MSGRVAPRDRTRMFSTSVTSLTAHPQSSHRHPLSVSLVLLVAVALVLAMWRRNFVILSLVSPITVMPNCAMEKRHGGTPNTAGRGRRTSRPVRRVLSPPVLAGRGETAIHLGLSLPAASCGLPADSGGQPSVVRAEASADASS